MAYHLFDTKISPKPIMILRQSHTKDETSMKKVYKN